MANTKNRTQLQNLFKSGAKPSEADFKDLIEGALNIADDGIEKPKGADTPLRISTRGDQENALDLYSGEVHTWRINQKPTGGNEGLNIETGVDQSSKLFIESNTGNVGLGITKPIAKLHIQQSGSQNALRIDDENGDTTPLIVDADGNVGIGIDQPSKKLDVRGDTAIAGTLSITNDLTVTGTTNAGVLQVTTVDRTTHVNTDGAIYRKGGQVYLTVDDNFYIRDSNSSSDAISVYFITNSNGGLTVYGTGQSSFAGSLAIGSTLSVTQTSTLTGNVGIGIAPSTEKLKVNGDTAITGDLSLTGATFNTGKAVMTGASNDYIKAQWTLSGGGTVTWEGKEGRLKWTARFIAITMGKNSSFPNGHININQPTTDIPAANVHDNQVRSATADGIILKDWEALYAIHTVGSNENTVSFKIVYYNKNFDAPSNWILVGVVNSDDNTLKLGTGTILSAKSSSTKGSPIPRGVIMMWYGATDSIPDGWAICNGQNGTPNLLNRFIVGAGQTYNVGSTGGQDTVTLTVPQMPSHNHANSDYKYLLRRRSDGQWSTGGVDTTPGEPDVVSSAEIVSAGGNQAHENRPPYYALCYIMKL